MAGVSARREDLGTGGGGGALALCTRAVCVEEFSYGQSGQNGGPALQMEFEVAGFDQPWVKNWTFGKGWSPIADGRGMEHEKGWRIGPKTNMGRMLSDFYESLDKLGVADDEVIVDLPEGGTDFTATFEGKKFRLLQTEYENQDGGTNKLSLVRACPETLETAAPAPKSAQNKGGIKGKSAAPTKSAQSVDEQTEEAILRLLEGGAKVAKKDLVNKLNGLVKGSADAPAILRTAFNESWLKNEARPFNFDSKKGVLTAREE